MITTYSADSGYSTTRLVTHEPPTLDTWPDDTFQTLLSLPMVEGRQGEGGLRTQGYFKHSLPEKPLITVITVVFNGAKYLEETILSIIEQTYDNVEYVIIDGGSTDGTLDIIRKYQHAIDYWVSEKDYGMYDAINKGIITSTGDINNFINSDDIFTSKHVIKEVATCFIKNNADCLYGNSVYIGEKGLIKLKKKTLSFKKRYFITLGMPFSQPTFFWKKELCKVYGLFNLEYKVASDYDFISRIALNSKVVIRLKLTIASFRIHGNSFGDNNSSIAIKEFRSIQKKLLIIQKPNIFYFLLDRVCQKFHSFF